MMSKVDEFLNSLIAYDKENIPEVCQKAILPYLKDPEFVPEHIKTKSSAAAGLCSWVINIMAFYQVSLLGHQHHGLLPGLLIYASIYLYINPFKVIFSILERFRRFCE